MPKLIALLKGINVGGHKKVAMAELRQLLTKEGLKNVQTYIQSGNVIFDSIDDVKKIEDRIQEVIYSHFGFEVLVIVKTRDEIQSVFSACPFSNEKKEKSYFIIFDKIPSIELIKEVSKIAYENEEFVIKEKCLYFYSPLGYGQAKFSLNAFERKLKVKGTARNYNTMVKLIAMSATEEKDH
ncbi:DUF1697 domain-containing protein [Gelidibacter sp.]|uniref:DUF1697 domain-containing protein n=1 Tax=Gelidibacter sp. TaxID=2018083 RepID=UPI002C3AA777|nr:DUF1697 domain-containing protein [Gelidibacter sp.]HUH27633.1 DUF1697 domain-containing protein [Gelidibacter sp.]